MIILLPQTNKNSIFFIFLCSLLIHTSAFIILFFFLHKPVANQEKQNLIYMQIVANTTNKTTNKIEKPKQLPKKPIIKKLVQHDSPIVKPAEKTPQTPNENKVNNQSPSSTQADSKDVAMNPIAEAVVDKVARCATPNIFITQDAANAGITSGKVILQVEISPAGKITEAKILKGTGFQIDNEVILLAKKMLCTPAEKDGKNVAVIKRLQWIILR